MQIPLINLKKQYETIKDLADEKILEVLHSAQYIMGQNVKEFPFYRHPHILITV